MQYFSRRLTAMSASVPSLLTRELLVNNSILIEELQNPFMTILDEWYFQHNSIDGQITKIYSQVIRACFTPFEESSVTVSVIKILILYIPDFGSVRANHIKRLVEIWEMEGVVVQAVWAHVELPNQRDEAAPGHVASSDTLSTADCRLGICARFKSTKVKTFMLYLGQFIAKHLRKLSFVNGICKGQLYVLHIE